MSEPWKTPAMREWAERFLEEEREAGRTYCVVQTGHKSVPGGSVTNYNLLSSPTQVSVGGFRQLVIEFMERHDWYRDDDDKAWLGEVETVEMAVITYVRDVVQAA